MITKTNNKINKKKLLLIILIFLIILITIIVSIKINTSPAHINNKIEKKVTKTLIGQWTTDGNTVYEFGEDKRGALIVPVVNLPFSYIIDGNIITIDFDNEDSDDITYTYEITEDSLILNGKNGIFEFKRMNDE